MASMETGGAATAIGIWYQSLGAAAALTPNWDFRKGLAPNIHGEALEPYQQPERLRVLLEYFDMDLAITDYSGVFVKCWGWRISGGDLVSLLL
jgi:hypothetical protein